MAIHSSQYSWKMSWTEESGGLSPWGHKESDVTEHTRPCFIFPVPFPGETVDLLTVKPAPADRYPAPAVSPASFQNNAADDFSGVDAAEDDLPF